MPFDARVVSVMISAPSDVQAEVMTVRRAVDQWNSVHSRHRSIVLLPLDWRSGVIPNLGERAQSAINEQLLPHADLLVAVFWSRLGTPTGTAQSGSVEEIEAFLTSKKRVFCYFCRKPVTQPADTRELARLSAFRDACRARGWATDFTSEYELTEHFRSHLDSYMNTLGAAEALSPGPPSEPSELGDKARELLRAAAKDRHGRVLFSRRLGGGRVVANRQVLFMGSDAAQLADWSELFRQLVQQELLAPASDREGAFDLTARGHRLAKELPAELTAQVQATGTAPQDWFPITGHGAPEPGSVAAIVASLRPAAKRLLIEAANGNGGFTVNLATDDTLSIRTGSSTIFRGANPDHVHRWMQAVDELTGDGLIVCGPSDRSSFSLTALGRSGIKLARAILNESAPETQA